ncbi:MAG: NADP-dependent oxidoreductase [Chloroflexota bacterium]
MSSIVSREYRLKRRPVGLPTVDNFELASVALPDPQEGEFLVKNHYLSVDPYMRGRMIDRPSYAPPWQIGQVMEGGAIGEVIASQHPDFMVGQYVIANTSWREYYIGNGIGTGRVDPNVAPLSAWLGTAGMPGRTAYFGLLDIGRPQRGETVFVSGAAGAVGSVVCQIAKLKGCRVIGSAGSDSKVEWLKNEIGVDGAINYRQYATSGELIRAVKALAPDGIDIYFENVGGMHLEAAMALLNINGRIPVCGMISGYNDTSPTPGPSNLFNIIGKRLLLKGFIVSDYDSQIGDFYRDMGSWLKSGEIKLQETIVEGIENMPQAFIGLFTGENLGKMVVKV